MTGVLPRIAFDHCIAKPDGPVEARSSLSPQLCKVGGRCTSASCVCTRPASASRAHVRAANSAADFDCLPHSPYEVLHAESLNPRTISIKGTRPQLRGGQIVEPSGIPLLRGIDKSRVTESYSWTRLWMQQSYRGDTEFIPHRTRKMYQSV